MIGTILRFGSFALVLLLGCSLARASSVALGTWYEFSFFDTGTPAMGCFPADPSAPECIPSSGTPTTFAGAPDWTFLIDSPGARLTVTDVFYHGDAFEIFDHGNPIGSTSTAQAAQAADFLSCGDDPMPCLSDPLTSKGTFFLDRGAHAISIIPNSSPYGGGVGFFRMDAVPEPGGWFPAAIGLALFMFGRRCFSKQGGAQ